MTKTAKKDPEAGTIDSKKPKTRTAPDYHVTHRRPWLLVSDDGEEAAVLMAKNITKLTDAILAIHDIEDNKTARKTFKQFLDLVEFAPVTIDKNGQIKWKQGKFANRK